MKKIMRLWIVAMLAIGSMTSVFAKESSFITFDGKAGDFIEESEDLGIFDNFENLYPGESRRAKLILKNTDDRPLKFWLGSEQLKAFGQPGVAYTLDFLIDGQSILSGDIGGENQVGMNQIGNKILITELKKGETATLEIVLTTDGDSMDNSYQGTLGEMKYSITVEYDEPTVEIHKVVQDKVVEKDRVVYDTVDTGDSTMPMLMTTLFVGSLMAMAFIVVGKKKGKEMHEND